MKYTTQVKIRFGEVDAAGIVFYPRYFEMLNNAVEDWFEDVIGMGFAKLHKEAGIGVPTVKLKCDFSASSFLGETLDIELDVRRLGRSSCTIAYRMTGRGTDRLAGEVTLVCVNLTSRKAISWPSEIRARIEGKAAIA